MIFESRIWCKFLLECCPTHLLINYATKMELAERRARLEEEAARKIAEKEMKPKKPRPAPKTDWVVSCIKGMKIAQEKTWYQVNPCLCTAAILSS